MIVFSNLSSSIACLIKPGRHFLLLLLALHNHLPPGERTALFFPRPVPYACVMDTVPALLPCPGLFPPSHCTNTSRGIKRKPKQCRVCQRINASVICLWFIHTVEYYHSSVKSTKVLVLATALVNLENTKPREGSQTRRVTWCMLPFL